MSQSTTKPLQRIGEVRRREDVSLRTLSSRLKLEVSTIKKLCHPETDMRLSDLYLVAEAIGVPAVELLQDTDADQVQKLRSLLVRIAKIANAILETASGSERLQIESIKSLIDQDMPSDCIQAMHAVGERRSLDEPGRLAQGPLCVSDLNSWVDHQMLLDGGLASEGGAVA